jgi:hypothetical protein
MLGTRATRSAPAAAPGDDERGTRAHPANKHTQNGARRHKAWARASRRELVSMANTAAGWYERRRGRPPVRRSGDRVVSALFFFPRGGSAQVARALCRALPTIGWEVSLAAGSLGSAGEQGHAPSFFSGVDVVSVGYSPARRWPTRLRRPERGPAPACASGVPGGAGGAASAHGGSTTPTKGKAVLNPPLITGVITRSLKVRRRRMPRCIKA